MQILVFLVGMTALVGLTLSALALYWANTPHGRIKPIFALVFGLTNLRGGRQAGGVIDAASMTSPDASRAIRKEFTKSTAALSRSTPFEGRVEEKKLDGPGGLLPVRIYTPNGEGPFPLLVYLHGGGFVVGSPDYTDAVTRGIAQLAPAIVVSVDYRMAPEAPFPAAVEDTCFAVEWCFENAAMLGARPGPVLSRLVGIVRVVTSRPSHPWKTGEQPETRSGCSFSSIRRLTSRVRTVPHRSTSPRVLVLV